MSFIDTPAASSSSTPANSSQRSKRPAVPRYAQTLSTPEALDLFANDKTAQKICSYFEDPDIILAINKLAKVSRAHQQEEQEIRLARHRSCVRQTMATILLDQLQSWGLERELYDVLKEYHRKSPTPRKLSVFSLTSTPLQNAVPSRPLPARFTSRLHSLKISRSYASTSTISKNNDLPMKLVQHFVNYNESLNERDVGHLLPLRRTRTHSTQMPPVQRTTNTLTPIMEELMRIFSTTPESQTPQANHTGTNELEEVIDFTPSEA
ncbi:hypothetical protein CVT25_008909 [Psilocybe cyanescens]|uniref:Uncharacterized protein n=1 Tax=Psilocybe cyanescens TaxID=93625 RepID=A0A409XL65_PSICY|nr:hypothetical protein CVT25_008909 [Psilocybe cyanescens]